MAHIWIQERVANDWAVARLDGDAFALSSVGGRARVVADSSAPHNAAARLLRSHAADDERWVLLAADPVLVNGVAVRCGMRVLADRDEIRFGAGGQCFFSTELLACIVPFPGVSASAFCPRCKQPIEPETAAVRCPRCAVWHHQGSDRSGRELPCWLYGPFCSLCDQATELSGIFRWSPAEL